MSYFRGQMHRKSLSVPEFPRKSRGALTGNDEIQFTVSVSVVECVNVPLFVEAVPVTVTAKVPAGVPVGGGGPELPPPPQPIVCSKKIKANTAKGKAPTRRCRRVRAKRRRTMPSMRVRRKSGTHCGRRYNLPVGKSGGAIPRAMVVTLTLAVPLPLANTFGFTVQVVLVAAIGREQDKLTGDANPFCAVTEMALVKVAVWPALTVCVVVPVEVMLKSIGPGVKESVMFAYPPRATGLGSGGPKEPTIM